MGTYQRKAELLEAEVANDIVALDPELGKCFGFNEVAATVWRRLESPQSFDELKAYLIDNYEVDSSQCDSELRALLDDLIDMGLIAKTKDA